MALRFLGILTLLLAAYLVGNNTTSLWDRDEPRYAQASREMAESSPTDPEGWVVPKLLGEDRLKKPPAIYWCQATAMKWLGINAGSARLPSVIATLLALVLIFASVASSQGGRTAIWTAGIYGTAALTIAAAKMAITDALFTLFVLAALVCLYRVYVSRGGWGTTIGLGVSIGLAGLTKGPIVLGVLGMTVLFLFILRLIERRWPARLPEGAPEQPPQTMSRPLHPLRMIGKILLIVAVVVAIVGPWIHAVEQVRPGAVMRTLYEEVFVRAAKPQEGHKGPPGYYLLTVWGTFFPWSLLLPAAIVEAWRLRGDRTVRFALAAVVGPWIMFELVATKLPHYVLPTFAPLAYLVARVLMRSDEGETEEFHQPHWPNIVAIWAVVVALTGIAPWLAAYFFHPLPWQTYVAFVILTVWAIFYGVKVHAEFDRRYPAAAGMWMGLGMLGNVFVMYTLVFPVSQYMRLGQRVADLLPHDLKAGDAIMIDYKEMSLAFYQGGQIRPEDDDFFTRKPNPADWPKYLVATTSILPTLGEPAAKGYEPIGQVKGWNYAGRDSADRQIVEVVVLKRRA